MEWHHWVLFAIVTNWGIPILTWLYPLVAWLILRDIKPVGFCGPFLKFRLLGDDRAFWWGSNLAPCGEYSIVGRLGRTYQLSDGVLTFPALENDRQLDLMEPWHARAWSDWAGVGMYWFMIYRDRPAAWDDDWVPRTIAHESAHCSQYAILGSLHTILYALHVLFIYAFQKDKHPYLDCWAERQARRQAGQQVDIPREKWPQGPKDRWPWW